LVNSAKTELQVQKEMDKKRFLTSAPHGMGATPYTETMEYQDFVLLWGWLVILPRTVLASDRHDLTVSSIIDSVRSHHTQTP